MSQHAHQEGSMVVGKNTAFGVRYNKSSSCICHFLRVCQTSYSASLSLGFFLLTNRDQSPYLGGLSSGLNQVKNTQCDRSETLNQCSPSPILHPDFTYPVASSWTLPPCSEWKVLIYLCLLLATVDFRWKSRSVLCKRKLLLLHSGQSSHNHIVCEINPYQKG